VAAAAAAPAEPHKPWPSPFTTYDAIPGAVMHNPAFKSASPVADRPFKTIVTKE
jgi:hypothetical protein